MFPDNTTGFAQDTTTTVPDTFGDSPTPDTPSENPDRFTDNQGLSYIAVRICELDRFCSK